MRTCVSPARDTRGGELRGAAGKRLRSTVAIASGAHAEWGRRWIPHLNEVRAQLRRHPERRDEERGGVQQALPAAVDAVDDKGARGERDLGGVERSEEIILPWRRRGERRAWVCGAACVRASGQACALCPHIHTILAHARTCSFANPNSTLSMSLRDRSAVGGGSGVRGEVVYIQ